MDQKEAFLKKDRIIKGITKDGFFKISVVKTTEVVAEAKERHSLSLLNTVMLGRALTGVMLLASELKGEERVQLRVDGDGPIGTMITEANSIGEIRGYVLNPDAELAYNENTDLGDGLGEGTLSFSKILYDEARPLTGVVDLISGNMNDDIAHYLLQSEQIPSAISLDVQVDQDGNVTEAGGILIQALPGSPEEKILQLEDNLRVMKPIGKLFEDGYYIDDIMEMATSPFETRELQCYPVHFFCRCSKDRYKDILAMMTYDDLKEISDTGQELVCHYCNEHYYFSKEEIDQIIKQVKIKLN